MENKEIKTGHKEKCHKEQESKERKEMDKRKLGKASLGRWHYSAGTGYPGT